MRSPLVISPRTGSFGRVLARVLIPLGALLLSGCDLLGESAADIRARKAAQSHAEGAACRQVGMSLQECMDENKGVKASILEGWKEMDLYMRENNMAEAPRRALAAPQATAEAGDKAPVKETVSTNTGSTPLNPSTVGTAAARPRAGLSSAEAQEPPPSPKVQHRVLVSRELDQSGSRYPQ